MANVKLDLPEHRCRHCGHLLFKGRLVIATVEIKCTNGNCRAFNMFEYALDTERVPVVA
jgi:phage FluMu protein Com